MGPMETSANFCKLRTLLSYKNNEDANPHFLQKWCRADVACNPYGRRSEEAITDLTNLITAQAMAPA